MNVQQCACRWLIAVVAVLIAGTANADTYPTRPVKFVVPFLAGGNTDLIARLFAQKMSETWGQPVVVENRTGAAGIIGSEVVARSAPDGYTILFGTIGTHAVSVSLYKKLPYDPERDFAPITLLATVPSLLVVNPSFPVRNVKELIDNAKANPGKLAYASPGAGTGAHLAGEMLRKFASVDIFHVPYRGSAPVITDLIAGRISMYFDYMPSVLPFVKSGKLRGLAVTGSSRAKVVPEIPTMIEEGLPEFNIVSWYAVYAPKGTPPDIVSKIRNTIAMAASVPEIVKRLDDFAVDLVAGTTEELARFQRAEIERWSKLIREANIKVD